MTGRRRAAQIGFVVIVAAAAVNLIAGAAIGLRDPHRAADLWTMYGWCRDWLFGGQSLYTGPEASTDYPPNAIVLLAPMAWLAPRWLVPLWTAAALALTPVLPWLVVRGKPGADRAARLVPILLFLCWAAPRTLLQFSLLSMTLSWVALLAADSRRLIAGVALGLALCKPQIAAPVALWMLVTGRVRPLLTAAAVVAIGWSVYDARIGESPLTTVAGYWHVLGSEYTGPEGLVGHASIRGWTGLAASDPGAADALWLTLSLVLLIALCWLAARGRSGADAAGRLAIPGLFGLWSLLVTYHNGNNAILALPAFAFLWFRRDAPMSALHWLPIVLLQLALMYDVPVRLAGAAAVEGWRGAIVRHFDRAVMLAALACVSAAWYRLTQSVPIARSGAAAAP